MRLSSEELGEKGSKTHWKEGERDSNRDRNSSALQKEDVLLGRCVLP